jgi:hypothetical protein
MARGFDTSTDCSTVAVEVAKAGVSFVGRYYANSGKKRLRQAEAYALRAAGLKIVTVWEDGSPTRAGYFSYAKGVDDSTSAYHDALLLGQPKGSAIYFAVDFDASQFEVAGVLNDYFRGIAAGFMAASSGNPEHPVGVYGSGATCAWMLARGLAKYSWLAMSSGWSGSDFDGWSIKQSQGDSIAGVDFDADHSASDDYGGFVVL